MRPLRYALAGALLAAASVAQAALAQSPPGAVQAAAEQAECLQVRVVSNDFVLPAKAARLDRWGRPFGVCVSHRSVDGDDDPSRLFAGAQLLVLDTPRPSDAAEVKQRLQPALAAAGLPWVQVGGGPPASAQLPAAVARRIGGYYAAGGEANFHRFLEYLGRWHRDDDPERVPAAEPLPATGYYHPQAGQAFANAQALAAWWQARGVAGMPRVAVLVAANAIGSMETGVLDAVIDRAAAHGVQAFGLWFDASDERGLSAALEPLMVDAIVNLTHLQNGQARQAEFLELDVPVIQTLSSRQGTAEAWRSASSGVAPALVATFIAVPEGWGMSDPIVIGAVEEGEQRPIPEQVDALAAKLARLAALRRKPDLEKRLALMFWNYPAGENNLSASHLNVPRSVALLSERLAASGYKVRPTTEQGLIMAGQAMLSAYHRPEVLQSLLDRDLAEAFPVERYRRWLQALPARQREALLARWGQPERHPAVRTIDGEAVFVIPRLRLGHLLVMPQPPRSDRLGQSSHDQQSLPSHYYLAAYQFIRESYGADALIHFGTHGTQEWTPGKDRGLWVNDYPYLALGDLPVFYPYIQDNIGEAIQAKRRGRAVIVSHQTPAFAPAGLYDELRDLHAQVHEYMQLDEGGVRERTAALIGAAAVDAGIAADMGWTADAIDGDFPAFFQALHDHLHELARSAMPLGLHTFGQPAAAEHRLSTVMQQLGEPYYLALGLDPAEVFADDYADLQRSEPYRVLHRHLREGVPPEQAASPALREQIQRALERDAALADTQEIESLLRGLAGAFVPPGAGGDPIRNPEVRSGRNLFAFEPNKIPTRAAYAAGGEALAQLVAAYRQEHGGQAPAKLAFSLWSSEAIRHLGVLESQVLHALGLRPVWDEGGRVTALELLPDAELAHPRIDVVLQVTSVYRDQFDGFMRLLAEAIDRVANLDDGNPVARNREALAARLVERGLASPRAQQLAALRIFSNAPGEYGSGLTDAVLEEREDKSDEALAEGFLARLQYAYGAREWGLGSAEAGNLFAEQLRGVQAAVLARSSNLHGMLSTDHPFEYLGGLSLAVRHLDGASPALYVSDLRQQQGRTARADAFLASELRSRYLNPHWIGQMQQEGYAGTLQVLNVVNNLFGWQVTDPSMVRADQWQAVHDTYVRDVRRLGIEAWFDANHPTAHAQLIERMQEAIKRGYWQPDARTREELEQRLGQLTGRVAANAAPVLSAAGFGVDRNATASAQAAPPSAPSAPVADVAAAEQPVDSPADAPVRGQVMREVDAPPQASADALRQLPMLLLLAACIAAGAWFQLRRNTASSR